MSFFPNILKFTISFVASGSQLTQVIYLRSLSYLEHWCNPAMDHSGEAILTATSYHRNWVTLSDHLSKEGVLFWGLSLCDFSYLCYFNYQKKTLIFKIIQFIVEQS